MYHLYLIAYRFPTDVFKSKVNIPKKRCSKSALGVQWIFFFTGAFATKSMVKSKISGMGGFSIALS